MIPQEWKLKRPGLMIPVFFLSLIAAESQEPVNGIKSMSLAGCFVTETGNPCSLENQAGLARGAGNEICYIHAQPFFIRDFGISSLVFRFSIPHGGVGMTVSTSGISGMRYYSAWIGCGLRLGKDLSAGVGLHLLDFATSEYGHYPGAGCAIGFRYKAGERLVVGWHIRNPVSLAPGTENRNSLAAILSAGIAYTFFEAATWYSELQASAHGTVSWVNGLEAVLSKSCILMAGIRTDPLTLSAGVSLPWKDWRFTPAFSWNYDAGICPGFSIGYKWGHD